jgi:hypothetical protein
MIIDQDTLQATSFFDTDNVKLFSFINDLIAFIAFITAAIGVLRNAYLKKEGSPFWRGIAQFLKYYVRTIVALFGLLVVSIPLLLIYGLLTMIIKAFTNGSTAIDYFFCEEGQALAHILAYLFTSVVAIPMFIIVVVTSWSFSTIPARKFINWLFDREIVAPIPVKGLRIISANYGSNTSNEDVSNVLRERIVNNTLNIAVNNDLVGKELHAMAVKRLIVEYTFGSPEVKRIIIQENDSLILP